MPYHMAMSDHMSSFQFWSRAQEAASRLEAAEARLAELDRAPSTATTAGERQSIDTPEFRELLGKLIEVVLGTEKEVQYGATRAALIAHIDTWAARSAGDAVPLIEDLAKFNGAGGMQVVSGFVGRAKAILGAAPGNTAQPTAYDTMDHDQLSKLGQQQKGEHDGR
jgi:hypothetical protein